MSVKTKAYTCPHCMVNIESAVLANLWEWICTRKHVYKENSVFEILDQYEDLMLRHLESKGYIISTDIGENLISVSPSKNSECITIDKEIISIYCINIKKHWDSAP